LPKTRVAVLVSVANAYVDTCAYSQFRNTTYSTWSRAGATSPEAIHWAQRRHEPQHQHLRRPTCSSPAAVPATGLRVDCRSQVERASLTTTPASPSQLHDLETLVSGWNSVKATWPDGVVSSQDPFPTAAATSLYITQRLPVHGCLANTRVILLVWTSTPRRTVAVRRTVRWKSSGKGAPMLYANNIGDV
jgi:hypothetical protein